VEITVEAPEVREEQYFLHKAYIVWYSWPKYERRREIAIEFWRKSGEFISEGEIRGWMNRAVRTAFSRVHSDFRINADTINNWGHSNEHYEVTDASISTVRTDISDYTANLVNWWYELDGSVIETGSFFK